MTTDVVLPMWKIETEAIRKELAKLYEDNKALHNQIYAIMQAKTQIKCSLPSCERLIDIDKDIYYEIIIHEYLITKKN